MSLRLISPVAALAFVAMSLPACTRTMVLSSTSPQSDYDEVNRAFAGRDAKVRIGDGRGRDFYGGLSAIRDLNIQPDSVRFESPFDGRVAVPAETFVVAEYRDRTRGALEGALYGGIGFSIIAGAATVVAGGSRRSGNSFFGPSSSSDVGEAFLGGAIAGAITGVIVGAIRTSGMRVLRAPSGPTIGFKGIAVAPVTVGVTTDSVDVAALAVARWAIVDALRESDRYKLVASKPDMEPGVLRVECQIDDFDNGNLAARSLSLGTAGKAHLHTSCRFLDAGDDRLYAMGAFTADTGGRAFSGSSDLFEEMAREIARDIALFLASRP
ncbi:MAG: hypothetical protein BMS9Abin29_1386 [Gemmatimonadota bacterium]|nr:MAG: hypothetical protein BMS9Abin29_1386 [Gemmatimonadota bacterium]